MYLSEFSYGFDYNLGGDFTAFGFLLYLLYLLVTIGVAVAVYVMQSLSLYSIASRRGIRKPWLAWVPVGNMWIMGCISDQYRYVTQGQVKNKRKALLVLNILMYAALAAMMALFISMIVQLVGVPEEMLEQYILAQALGTAVGMMLLYFVMMGLSIAVTVLQYMALYDLYASCEPSNKVLYLVLNIFISITLPIFLLVCRKKDLGMPPRKKPAAPAQTIPEPWTEAPQEEEPWSGSEE